MQVIFYRFIKDIYKLDHIGVVVDNFDKALDLWKKSFNVDVKPMEYQVPFSMTRGTPNPYTMKTAFVDMGPVRMELINIVQGETLHTEFLNNKERVSTSSLVKYPLKRFLTENQSFRSSTI